MQGFRERAEIEKREMQLRHRRELQDALQKQEKHLEEKFDQERKEIELHAASERNALEREFAEQKMEMMNRLQADFDTEIHRLSQGSPTASKASESLQKRIEELEGDLGALKNGYNHRLREQDTEYSQMISDLQRKHAEELDALRLQVIKLKDSHAVNFDQVRHPDQLPPQLQRLFYGLLDLYKAEIQANSQRDQQQMLEAFQRERVDALGKLELEHQDQGEIYALAYTYTAYMMVTDALCFV